MRSGCLKPTDHHDGKDIRMFGNKTKKLKIDLNYDFYLTNYTNLTNNTLTKEWGDDSWWYGTTRSLLDGGLEAVLISDVVHGILDTIRTDPGVGSSNSNELIFRASVSDLSVLIMTCTVTLIKPVKGYILVNKTCRKLLIKMCDCFVAWAKIILLCTWKLHWLVPCSTSICFSGQIDMNNIEL